MREWVGTTPTCSLGCQCGRHTSSASFKAGQRADGSPALGTYIDAHGYRILTGQQGHPLSCQNGELKEHRKVLYEQIGSGAHSCHWCERTVEWQALDFGSNLCVDHVDSDKINNDPSNLVPSCRPCNSARVTK